MKNKEENKAMEGDIVEFKRVNAWTRREETKATRGVVIGRTTEEDLTVVLSLFPYTETRLCEAEVKVVNRNNGETSEYNVGDLVRLRGSDNVLFIEHKFETYRMNNAGWTYNVKEVSPSTGRKSRFVQSCLLERIE